MEAVEDAEWSGWEFPDCHPDVLDVSDWSSLPSLVIVHTAFTTKTLQVIAQRYHITLNAENQSSDNMLCGF